MVLDTRCKQIPKTVNFKTNEKYNYLIGFKIFPLGGLRGPDD
jgi:hypothetical protein